MNSKEKCSLWIFASRTDIAFMMQTIPHIVRMCNYPFAEKVLAIDVAEPSGYKLNRPNLGQLSEIRERCEELVSSGVMDRVVDIDYSDKCRKKIYKKHFGVSHIKNTHNYKGYPVFGSMYCIEESATDHMVHFDSDMLIYQNEGYDWISEGIKELALDPTLMWTRCYPGYKVNVDGEQCGSVFKRKKFSSRAFLVDRRKLSAFLPMNPLWAAKETQGKIGRRMPYGVMEVVYSIMGNGVLDSWEDMMTQGMNAKGFSGGWVVRNEDCWTLHPKDHGEQFLNILPDIIKKVESGVMPDEQVGNYDVNLDAWLKYLGKE